MPSILAIAVLLAASVSGQSLASAPLPSPIVNSGACTATGPWQVSPSHLSSSGWLTADLNAFTGKAEDVSVVFKPQIDTNANYTVTMYTPGCIQADTCDQRGNVNLNGYYIIGNLSGIATQISQTNDYDKYEVIYHGPINASSNSFSPSVKLAPLSNSKGLVVAQRFEFILINGSALGPTSATGSNVLAENATINTDIAKSTVSTTASPSASMTSGGTTTSTTTSNATSNSLGTNGKSGGLTQGAKIGIGVGVSLGVLLLCAIVALVVVCYRLLQARKLQGSGVLSHDSRRGHTKPELMNMEKSMHELSSANRGKDPSELMTVGKSGYSVERHELPIPEHPGGS